MSCVRVRWSRRSRCDSAVGGLQSLRLDRWGVWLVNTSPPNSALHPKWSRNLQRSASSQRATFCVPYPDVRSVNAFIESSIFLQDFRTSLSNLCSTTCLAITLPIERRGSSFAFKRQRHRRFRAVRGELNDCSQLLGCCRRCGSPLRLTRRRSRPSLVCHECFSVDAKSRSHLTRCWISGKCHYLFRSHWWLYRLLSHDRPAA